MIIICVIVSITINIVIFISITIDSHFFLCIYLRVFFVHLCYI